MIRKITANMVDEMIEKYQNGMSTKEIGKIFDIHYSTVSGYLKQRGVFKPKTHNWTEADTQKLIKVYPTGNWDLILKAFPNRSREVLYSQASKLGIHSDEYFWTQHDKDILTNLYGNIDVQDIQKILDKEYTIRQIQNQAGKMNLTKSRFWIDEEVSIMQEKYPSLGAKGIEKFLPNKSHHAIIGKAVSMGLTCDCYWSDDEIKFLTDNWPRMSDEEISEALGRGVKGVADKRRKLGMYYELGHNGYYTIINYIRMNIADWKRQSMESCNYKCVLTGENFDDIHHLYSFNLLLKESIQQIGIDDRESIDDYTDEELNNILDMFKNIQSQHPLGVCLSRTVHTLFHHIYGYGNNTEEQWVEFSEKYKQGLFN